MIFWGFVVLFIATVVVLIDYDLSHPDHAGRVLPALSVAVCRPDAAPWRSCGILLAGVRRWIVRPKQLVYTTESNVILLVILAILVSGFLVEGWRIAATDDPWGAWSPVGNLVAAASRAVDVGRRHARLRIAWPGGPICCWCSASWPGLRIPRCCTW